MQAGPHGKFILLFKNKNMTYLQTVYAESVRPKSEYPQKLARHLADLFSMRPGSRLLDVGCGRGDFAAAFAMYFGSCFSGLFPKSSSTKK